MRFLKAIAVFVIAVISVQGNLCADENEQQQQPIVRQYQSSEAKQPIQAQRVSTTNTQPGAHVPNGFAPYRQQPDLGAGHSASHGYKHFPSPLHRFGKWYRPRASTLTPRQRCAPTTYRPRGYGDLFARPCDPFRMDYTPYVMHESESDYGPAYLRRACDPRCNDCNHCR